MPTTSLSWVIPMSPQSVTVGVGDVVQLSWGGFHNVFETSPSSTHVQAELRI